jgi:curved DNA-binding protein CbpA
MPTSNASTIREAISSKLALVHKGDYFDLLGVPDSATPKTIKDAYFALARLVHPDVMEKHNLTKIKDDAALVFNKITEAYRVLSDPELRARYVESRKALVRPVDDEKLVQEQAKIALHQGKILLRQRVWDRAEEHFRALVELAPGDARGYLYLGHCLMQNATRPLDERLVEARFLFAKALELQDSNPEAHYYMSLYHKERGDSAAQEKSLKKTLELKPDHIAAAREVRLLEMRRGTKENSSPTVTSFLNSILGRFKNRNKK